MARPLSDAERLWRGYLSSGEDLFHRLRGVFSLILYDARRARLLLFRSPLIGRSLYYAFLPDRFLAASRTEGILMHPGFERDLDDAWLANYFAFRTPQSSATPFRAVRELLPGELLTVTRDDHRVTRRPPDIGGRRIHFAREKEYVEQFDELVSRAVARSVRGRVGLAVMLSGGLDSVPVAWWLNRHRAPGCRVMACSWSLRRFPQADESRLIEQSAETIGIPLRLLPGDDLWPLKNPQAWPLCPDTPQQNAFRLLKEAIYAHAASDGCRYIFNGNYGDNLYPEYHHVLADALYGGSLGRFAGEIQWLVRRNGVRGLYRSSAFRQVAKRGLRWRSKTRIPEDTALTGYALARVDWERCWPPEMSEHRRPDHYRGLLGAEIARGINGEQYFTGRYGLELVEPYMDWDLVDFVLSVPSHLFWNRGTTKVLMREAMRGRIPEEVRTRPRGGLLDTFFHYGIDRRLDWMRKRLLSPGADWPRFVERKHIGKILDNPAPSEVDKMRVFQCAGYEMWLDRYFR